MQAQAQMSVKDSLVALDKQRIDSANAAIDQAGGPGRLADKINSYLGADSISGETVRVWRVRGIPERWTTTVEHLTGVPRHHLNPQMYVVGYED